MACQPELLMLSNSDARRLTDSYRHYLSFPNIVSISYCDEKKRGQKTGRKVLCFGVVKKLECDGIVGANLHLPKSVQFETENKVKVEIPVQMVEEGEIVALNATYSFEGGKLVKKETNKKVSKYNSLNEVGQKPVDRICPGDKNNVAILHLFEKKANPGKSKFQHI